jgi:hypothetical protein
VSFVYLITWTDQAELHVTTATRYARRVQSDWMCSRERKRRKKRKRRKNLLKSTAGRVRFVRWLFIGILCLIWLFADLLAFPPIASLEEGRV